MEQNSITTLGENSVPLWEVGKTSRSCSSCRHHKKVEFNNGISPIQDEYIEKMLSQVIAGEYRDISSLF